MGKKTLLSVVAGLLILLAAGLCYGSHGISIDGKLKYPRGFSRFDYTSDRAGQGGTLQLHSPGSFDKMNPFTLKGEAPLGLEMFVFEKLCVASLDEPFSEYGLIAKDIEVADDLLSVTYTINERAKFSDGSSIRAENVAFSMRTLKGDNVHPFYNYYYKDISEIEVLDEYRVRFGFSRRNRELPMIASQIPIFPKSLFSDSATGDSLGLPVGSGPYVVAEFSLGKSITYRRNPDYWGNDHPTRTGMFNFDRITVKYYKDQVVALEAFKGGEFDFMSINIAKQWARDLKGPNYDNGKLVKKLIPHSLNAGMQGFLMNSRREIFSHRKVREAMGLAFDFEWTNKTLFYGQYKRSNSFFSNSPFAATGLPTARELFYLEPFSEVLPEEIFSTELAPPVAGGRKGLRTNLRKARKLLEDAGWKIENGSLVDSNGNPFVFEILLVSPTFERVMASYVRNLKLLGIQASYRTIDPTIYTDRLKRFDFDMIVTSYGQSLSPGNEQRNFWHSSAATTKGSRNYAGISSPVVDSLIDSIVYAETTEELQAACRSLDRVLWYGYYLVPNWYMSGHRITYRNVFKMPSSLPIYYSPLQWVMTWWMGGGGQ